MGHKDVVSRYYFCTYVLSRSRVRKKQYMSRILYVRKIPIVSDKPIISMVFRRRRRTFRRKFRGRRRSFRRRRMRRVGRPRPELKVNEIIPSTISFDTAGGSTSVITLIGEGIGRGQRIGDKVIVKSISVCGDFAADQASAQVEEWVRFAIVQEKQQIGDTSPPLSAIYAQDNNPFSMRELASRGRFRVLASRTFKLDHRNVQTKMVFINFNFKTGLTVRYNGAATTDIQKNGLYVVLQSNALATQPTKVNLIKRVRYIDS